ncbi:Uncharacterised protein [Klebsiella pneumoniae]|nr:Uncharacterised protein [Klebsiella pneumoniae]
MYRQRQPVVIQSVFLPDLTEACKLLRIHCGSQQLLNIQIVIAAPDHMFTFYRQPVQSEGVGILWRISFQRLFAPATATFIKNEFRMTAQQALQTIGIKINQVTGTQSATGLQQLQVAQ